MSWSYSDNSSSNQLKSEWVSVPVGKAITASIMFVTVLAAIFTPIIIFGKLDLSKKRSSFKDKLQLWIGRLSCFAGGVFLSTGFMDIFPDVIRSIDEAGTKLNIKILFPLASFFTLIGFFLILSIEQLVLIYKSHLGKHNLVSSKLKGTVPTVDNDGSQDAFLPSISGSNDTIQWDDNKVNRINQGHSTNSVMSDIEHCHSHIVSENEKDEHGDIFHHNTSRIFALMSAMSVHAIFEGLAIGLGTTIAGVTQLFIVLSMHKLIIAASLGLNLGTAQLKTWVKITVSMIFSLASPIGIVLGILIMSQQNGHNVLFMVSGILEGIACGTFLYVVFFEILPHELGQVNQDDRGPKLTCVLFGFIFVSVYLLAIPKE